MTFLTESWVLYVKNVPPLWALANFIFLGVVSRVLESILFYSPNLMQRSDADMFSSVLGFS
jgi:hypothetical protein